MNRGLQIRRSVPFYRQIRRSAKFIVEIRNQNLWQAKHDKSGLSWKSPIEFQWSICEIEKSLFEIGKSLREIRKTLYEKLKLLYENEKMSCEIIIPIENEKLPCEIYINCWQWKIVVWEKEITIRDYRLVFFLSRWDISSQRRVFWRDFLLSYGQYKT